MWRRVAMNTDQILLAATDAENCLKKTFQTLIAFDC
jgi:hypothetical protein